MVKGNKFLINHTLAKDLVTEGNETLEVKLFTDADLTQQVGETKEITIEDVIPTYSVTPSTSSIAEGGRLRTTIRTTEVPNSTRLYYSLSGDGIDEDDLSQGSLTGSGVVKGNKFLINHTLAKDLVTEGNETLEIKLFTDADLTQQVGETVEVLIFCLLYTSPSPRDRTRSRMPSSA